MHILEEKIREARAAGLYYCGRLLYHPPYFFKEPA